MAKKKQKKSGIITIIILSVLLVTVCALAFIQINTLIKQNTRVISEKQMLTAQVSTLQGEKTSLESQIQPLQENLDAKTAEFDDYQAILKEYFSIINVIADDVEFINPIIQDYTMENLYSSIYGITPSTVYMKGLHKDLKSRLDIFKSHVAEFESFIDKNADMFNGLGLDVEDEKESIDQLLESYEDMEEDMRYDLGI